MFDGDSLFHASLSVCRTKRNKGEIIVVSKLVRVCELVGVMEGGGGGGEIIGYMNIQTVPVCDNGVAYELACWCTTQLAVPVQP